MGKPLEIYALVRDSEGVNEWHLVFDPVYPTSKYAQDSLIEALSSMLESVRSQPLIAGGVIRGSN